MNTIKPISNAVRAVQGHALYRLVVQVFTYGFGTAVQRALSLFLLPIYTRYLNPDDYGITGLLGVTAIVLGTITMCALTNGVARYFFYPEQEKARIEQVVWSPVLFVAGFSLLILTPIGLLSRPVSQLLFGTNHYAYLIVLTIISVFMANLSSFGTSILVFQERAMTVNLVNIANLLVGMSLGLFLVVVLRRGVTGSIEAVTLTTCIMALVISSISLFRYRLAFSWNILKKEIRFSLPLVAALVAFFIFDSSDRYFLKIFLPLSEVGLYNVGYSFGLIMMILVGGFVSAWPPYYHKHNQDGGGQSVCNNVLRIYLLVASICVVGLSVASPLILNLFTTKEFHKAYTIVPWVAMAYMLKGPYIIFLIGVLMKNKSIWQLYLEFTAAIVNLLGNLLLIPWLGREAAALTTFLSYATLSIGAYWMVMRVNPIPNLSRKFLFQIISLTLLITILITYANKFEWDYLWWSIGASTLFLGILVPITFFEFRSYLTRFRSVSATL